MKMTCNALTFTAEAEATVYFQAKENSSVGFSADAPLLWRLTDCFDNLLAEGCSPSASEAGSGDLRLTFLPDEKGKRTLNIWFSDNAVPYLMPGAGVLWDHGAVYPLLLGKEQSHTLFVPGKDDPRTPVTVIKGIPFGEEVSISVQSEKIPADWFPKLGRKWFWHSAELPAEKDLRFELPASESDIRFTVYNRTAVLLTPSEDFCMGKLYLSAADEDGNPIDARFELFVGSERVALSDQFAGESPFISLPKGKYTLRTSHGMLWSTDEREITVGDEPLTENVTLTEVVPLPEGWFWGELHTHSALEDATLFPRQVMRAARAMGRHFCFMTDKDIRHFDRYGLHDADKAEKFLALPGQEIMCHELHMNVLGTDLAFPNPEADHLDQANFDIEQRLENWLSAYRKMKTERPCLIMHNHPAHRAAVMAKGQPYFRSWWVSDQNRDFVLTENCGYQGWFDRLDRGRKLFAAWTGDGHDSTLMWPGMEGVCVHAGKLTAETIIDALENGRFFSCRAPGMFLDIVRTGENSVTVTAKAAFPIHSVELVGDSKVFASLDGEGCSALEKQISLPEGLHWVIARAKLDFDGIWDEKRFSFTPFMEAGYDAFTNPIFL